MKRKLKWAVPLVLIITALFGELVNIEFLTINSAWYLTGGMMALGYLLLGLSYYRSGGSWQYADNHPKQLSLTWLDYLKAMISWFDAFKRTYVLEPGLYYTGEAHDKTTPILVTANYRLTLFTILRKLKGMNVRILVIDTDGINVWCASGKQKFNTAEIMKQVNRYEKETLTDDKRPALILPKLSLSGVDIKALRQAGVKPIIGPVYAKQLPEYLTHPPLKDQKNDIIQFGFLSRLFTWLPGFVQFCWYFLLVVIIAKTLMIELQTWWILGLVGVIVTVYPLLFPRIPGKQFAVKGIWLALVMTAGIGASFLLGLISAFHLSTLTIFTFATSLFFGLSYTGNSAVSNYTMVRKETARYLPPIVVLYTVFIVANITYRVII